MVDLSWKTVDDQLNDFIPHEELPGIQQPGLHPLFSVLPNRKKTVLLPVLKPLKSLIATTILAM
jgi:hypothetical protein